jgi:diguanylate cyclase (GGDEF)-like protein/PAS domain S-box-containing protein
LSAFSVLCLAAFFAYAYLGLYALALDARARVHRLFFAGSTAFAVWALAYAVAHSADSVELYRAAYRLSAPFWMVCAPLALHFFVALTRPAWLDRQRWLPLLIYAPAAVLLWREWSAGLFAAQIVRVPLGWQEVPDLASPRFWALVAYYQTVTWAAIALTWRWGATAPRASERRQAHVILSAHFASLLGVTLDNLGWPGLIGTPVPSLAPVFPLFTFSAMAWALVRYRFLALTPSAIAPVLLRTMEETVLLLDERAAVVTGNEASRTLLGYGTEELAGRPLGALLRLDGEDTAFVARLMEHPRGTRREMTCVSKAGKPIPVMLTVSPLARRRGTPEGAVVVLRDISDAHRAAEQLRFMAQHDPLTRLPNRWVFQDRLDNAIELARRSKQGLAVLMLDLDRFKQINDSHGHAAGDALLREVAVRLVATLRRVDTVSRLGGDEFAIILPGLSEPGALRAALDRINDVLRGHLRHGPYELPLSASIGAVIFPDDGQTPEALVQQADLAMYAAKRARRPTQAPFAYAARPEAAWE